MALLFLLFLFCHEPKALKSPFPSQVEGLSIPNSHWLERGSKAEGSLLRGMAPSGESQIPQLKDLGVDSVLIFKRESRSEITGAKGGIKILERLGFGYKYISFLWKDLNYEESCLQTLEELSYLRKEVSRGRSVFLHCTGVLSGLYLILFDDWDIHRAFAEEMCEKGYAEGNLQKPSFVVRKIHESLTHFFYMMAKASQSGELDEQSYSQFPAPTKTDLKIIESMKCR